MPYSESNIIVAPATVFFAGQPIGYTRDATVLGENQDVLLIDDIQQIAGVADVRRLKVNFTLKTNLAEASLENIKLGLGSNAAIVIDSVTGKRRLDLDFTGDLPAGEVVFNTKGPAGILRTVRFYLGKITACGEANFDSRGYMVLPITIQICKHPSYAKLGYIEEEYVPAGTR